MGHHNQRCAAARSTKTWLLSVSLNQATSSRGVRGCAPRDRPDADHQCPKSALSAVGRRFGYRRVNPQHLRRRPRSADILRLEQVRNRLPAGGSRIRTIGPSCTTSTRIGLKKHRSLRNDCDAIQPSAVRKGGRAAVKPEPAGIAAVATDQTVGRARRNTSAATGTATPNPRRHQSITLANPAAPSENAGSQMKPVPTTPPR